MVLGNLFCTVFRTIPTNPPPVLDQLLQRIILVALVGFVMIIVVDGAIIVVVNRVAGRVSVRLRHLLFFVSVCCLSSVLVFGAMSCIASSSSPSLSPCNASNVLHNLTGLASRNPVSAFRLPVAALGSPCRVVMSSLSLSQRLCLLPSHLIAS